MKKEKTNNKKLLKDISEKLLSLMLVDAKLEVSEDKDNEALVVTIDAPDETGLIIGSRGRTLNSIQTILGMIFKKETGDWKRIFVDTSGWRDKEKDRLENLAENTAQRAIETESPQYLYNLTPSQRRTIHMFLSENGNVKTESQGEGKERCLVVTSEK
jgi:spoIIIJ-associated protein